MKRIMFFLVFGLIMAMSLTSCATPDAVVCDEPTADIVIRYGTPYYSNGAIIYYVYDGYYYYPHYNGAKWYYYRDTRPIRHHRNKWVNHGTRHPHKPYVSQPHGNTGKFKPNRGGHGGGHVGRPNGNRPNGGGHHGGNGGRPNAPRRR